MKTIYLIVILFICSTNLALAYKEGVFPGIGNYHSWQKAYEIYNQSRNLPLDQANQKVHEAISLYPYDGTFYLSLSTITNNYQAKINYLNKAYTLNPDLPIALFNIGKIYQSKGEIQKSANAFQKFLKIKPQNKEAWYYLGNDYNALKQYAQARIAYHNMNYLKPSDMGYRLQGSEYAKLGDFNQALAYYQEACRLNPENLTNWESRLAVAKQLNNQSEIISCQQHINSRNTYTVQKSNEIMTTLYSLTSMVVLFVLLTIILPIITSNKKKVSPNPKQLVVDDFLSVSDQERINNMKNSSQLPTTIDTDVTLDPYVLDSHSSLPNNINKKTAKREPIDVIQEKLHPKHDIINKVHEKMIPKHDIIDKAHEMMSSPHVTHQNIITPQTTIHPMQNLPAQTNFQFTHTQNPNIPDSKSKQPTNNHNIQANANLNPTHDQTTQFNNPVYENYSQASNDLDYPRTAYTNLNNPQANSTNQTTTNDWENKLTALVPNQDKSDNLAQSDSHSYENYSQVDNANDYPQTQYHNFNPDQNNPSDSAFAINSTATPIEPTQKNPALSQAYENYSQSDNDLEYDRTKYVQFSDLNNNNKSNNNSIIPDLNLNLNTINKNQNSDQAKLCTNCGKELDPNFSFCIYCSKVI